MNHDRHANLGHACSLLRWLAAFQRSFSGRRIRGPSSYAVVFSRVLFSSFSSCFLFCFSGCTEAISVVVLSSPPPHMPTHTIVSKGGHTTPTSSRSSFAFGQATEGLGSGWLLIFCLSVVSRVSRTGSASTASVPDMTTGLYIWERP